MNENLQKYILTFNIGSTSTKINVYDKKDLIFKSVVNHNPNELSLFKTFWEQENLRKEAIVNTLKNNGISENELMCVSCWGGHIRPCKSGVYLINDTFIEEVKSEKYGNHPADLSPIIALSLGKKLSIPALSIDPPTIYEFHNLAKYSGIKEIERVSRMQTLNQKATGRYHAQKIGKKYEDINLIIVHLGGGVSIVAHERGLMIDANNGLDGDGPFAPNRSGSLPVLDLVKMCYSDLYTYNEIKDLIIGQGGLVSYLGESDLRKIENEINNGNDYYKEVLDAMIYQIAKEIGAMSTVLKGEVDGIILTGGMANSSLLVNLIKERVSFISDVYSYPGELEMESLYKRTIEYLKNESIAIEL